MQQANEHDSQYIAKLLRRASYAQVAGLSYMGLTKRDLYNLQARGVTTVLFQGTPQEIHDGKAHSIEFLEPGEFRELLSIVSGASL